MVFMAKDRVIKRDKFFYAALIMCLVSLIYWTAYNINGYRTYHLTTETAIATLSFYYITHLSNLNIGLQFLTVGQHITPLTVAVIGPFFYFFPTPLTLMLAKAIILSLTGIIVFFVTRGITKSPTFSVAMTFAYLVNPAVIEMQFFEYHPELFIIPLYLLTFYFCMRVNKKAFYLSLFLLLCIFESILSIALMLGFGILAYEYIYDKEKKLKKERIKLAWTIVACTLIALVAYNIIYSQVQLTYTPSYPPAEKLTPFPLVPLFSMASYNASQSQGYSAQSTSLYATTAIEISIISFACLAVLVLIPTLLFISPWLAGIFFLHNIYFFYAWRYSYEVPGAMIGAMLGYLALTRLNLSFKPGVLISAASIIMCFFIMIGPFTTAFGSSIVYPASQTVLFTPSQSEITNLAQLRSIIAMVPRNASVMTQFNLYAYFANRQYIESITAGKYFKAEYIVSDENITAPLPGINEYAVLANYTKSGNYTILAQNGSAILWKKS